MARKKTNKKISRKKLPEKERKTESIVMAVAGAIVWLLTVYVPGILDDIVRAVGIFLLIYGVIEYEKRAGPLTRKQKKIIWIVGIIIVLFYILGIIFYSI
ncbi:hypothetical protein GF386_02160 [Candidatus Pacearchaeota archaeon]|nr:hypothetical protein [Candidatus Pacearchaeota archaeon]MBD3282972.1 hypothetical protein [Candidatus Pacearchaeota archaeon]